MRDTDLYARMLGIAEPWRVTVVELDTTGKTVTITVRLDADANVRCPHCGRISPRYDTRQRSWRHLDTMQFQTMLEADVPRVQCSEHGVTQISIPWAEGGSRFTSMFEALVIDWLKVASTRAVSTQLRLSWNAVDGIMQRAVNRGQARKKAEAPTRLAVD